MRIIDRYVIRQVLMPLGIGLIVFTFIFIIDALREYVEPLVAKGVPAPVLIRVLGTLVPQALALSIPMSLLLGLLVAFGRLSGDREFVALQACGVSLRRLLLPVGLVSVIAWAATSYVMLVAVPSSNQTFREITFNIIAQRAEGEVRPRIFFDDLANLVLYVVEVPRDGSGWNGVFMADTRTGPSATIYLARQGRMRIDRQARTVEVVLVDVAQHAPDADGYKISRYDQLTIAIDPASVFAAGSWAKGPNEMTIAELRAAIAEHREKGISIHNEEMAIHRKFAIPVACLVFGVIGLALGATNRRDGALGSFGLGLAIVFAYYIPMFLFPEMAKGGYVTPWLAVWMPNFIIGALAIVLFAWRNKVADQPIRVAIPRLLRREPSAAKAIAPAMSGKSPLRILDTYVSVAYARILVLSAAAALAVFYISTFIDLSGYMFKGTAPWYTVFEYLWFATPQIGYYVLPISVLIATLVTVGMLTRSSELIVMKACGVSLYRVAVPMIVCAALVGGMLFLLDSTILGASNRRAETLRDAIRGIVRLRPLERPWYVGSDGTIYRFRSYDSSRRRFNDVEVFEFAGGMERLARRTLARYAVHEGEEGAGPVPRWRLEDGWERTFAPDGQVSGVQTFSSVARTLEPAGFFAQEPPDARFMGPAELRAHADRLRTSGLDVLEQDVGVARKIAYPFVTLIMTVIAIPFAVTVGRSGTMAGIAAGIALALIYWGTISFSAALGTGGLLPPGLAAWAPNVLFGAGAVYLLLTART